MVTTTTNPSQENLTNNTYLNKHALHIQEPSISFHPSQQPEELSANKHSIPLQSQQSLTSPPPLIESKAHQLGRTMGGNYSCKDSTIRGSIGSEPVESTNELISIEDEVRKNMPTIINRETDYDTIQNP